MKSLLPALPREGRAVSALFLGGLLVVRGGGRDANVLVQADAAGNVQVFSDGRPVPILAPAGLAPTRATVRQVVIDGKPGQLITTEALLDTPQNDVLVIAPTGALNDILLIAPTTRLLGGSDEDVLTVGHGGLVGGLGGVGPVGILVGNVVGGGFMDGGAGHDTFNDGFATDLVLGGDGDDSYLWLPGTLTDHWDGVAGNDTAIVIGNDTSLGAAASDAFLLTADGSGLLFRRTGLVRFSLRSGSTELEDAPREA